MRTLNIKDAAFCLRVVTLDSWMAFSRLSSVKNWIFWKFILTAKWKVV